MMLKSHEKFHSANGRRQVLIVDDEPINRELLGAVLETDYEVFYAADGAEAMETIRALKDTLSLVMLDLQMPVLSGTEVLKRLKADSELSRIPVIVLTADQNAEIESLGLGAIDFIPKPYPQRGVILARVRRTIELSEDRDIIQSTERDPLTGLYNREFFYRYAEQFDQHHRDMSMDAIVVNVNHFHMINERFGTAYGDKVLRHIGEKLREAVADRMGIVCRREADVFMVYCPHGGDYKQILSDAALGLEEGNAAGSRVRLRMGVYAQADKSLDIERRFDRAKMASDTVRSSFSQAIGIYDQHLHERELYAEQLLEEFHNAIDEKQFQVYYQPKFDVRPEIPVLASAEALVRWKHPRLGMISPGVFIPLFEDNGLIQELDNYVWRAAARQIRDWKDRLGFSVPVSVNVSRIDMYDPHLLDTLQSILLENGLDERELLLEITESAYTQDSTQIIETVNAMRAVGFRIEMDDFGTGYSSLNMISSLPIDALKLDMQFIRNAFGVQRDTRMLEVIIDIADYLSVPVIAEGVETEEQFLALRAMGCDLIQGYYFSRPIPADEYERILSEGKDGILAFGESAIDSRRGGRANKGRSSLNKIVHALSGGFETIVYVELETNRYVVFSSAGRDEDLQIERSGERFFDMLRESVLAKVHSADRQRVLLSLQREPLLLQLLGGQAFSMVFRINRGGRAVYYKLKTVMVGAQKDSHLVIGLSNVDELMRQANVRDVYESDTLSFLRLTQELSADMESIYYVDLDTHVYCEYRSGDSSPEAARVGGGDFFADLPHILARQVCEEDRASLVSSLEKKSLLAALEENRSFTQVFRRPVDGREVYYRLKAVRSLGEDGNHVVIGVSNIDDQIRRERELASAREKANRDALTGVKSKHAFADAEQSWNLRIESGERTPFAVAFCDPNGLKTVNDTLGHAAGDRYICDACRIICNTFKHSPVYRIGGDEFVAILSGSDYEEREALLRDFGTQNDERRKAGKIVIACGLADYNPDSDKDFSSVFERADAAMYEDKARLKDGVADPERA